MVAFKVQLPTDAIKNCVTRWQTTWRRDGVPSAYERAFRLHNVSAVVLRRLNDQLHELDKMVHFETY